MGGIKEKVDKFKAKRKAKKAVKAKRERLSAKHNMAGLKKGPVAKIGDGRKKRKAKRDAERAVKVKRKRLSEKHNMAGLKKGPVAKKAYVKKTNQDGGGVTANDPAAAADQLKRNQKVYEKQGPVKKTVARVARDYAANAAYDATHGYSKEAKYEKKKLGSILSKHMTRNK